MKKDFPDKPCKVCGSTLKYVTYNKGVKGNITESGCCVKCHNLKSKDQRNSLTDRYIRHTINTQLHIPYSEISQEMIDLKRKALICERITNAERKKEMLENHTLVTYYNENKEEILSSVSKPRESVEQYESLVAFEESKVELSPTSEIGKIIEKLMRMEQHREEVYSHLKAINELLT